MHPLEALQGRMRSGVAQALRPRVWNGCALFILDLGISNFAGFSTRLGRIFPVQNQIYAFYHATVLNYSETIKRELIILHLASPPSY